MGNEKGLLCKRRLAGENGNSCHFLYIHLKIHNINFLLSEQHNNNDFKGRPASTGAYLKFQIMHKTDLDICAAEEFDRDNGALFSPDTARADIESSGTREAAEDIVADNEKVNPCIFYSIKLWHSA